MRPSAAPAARGASAAMRSRACSKASSAAASSASSCLSRALVILLASAAARGVIARPLDASASVALAFADGGRGNASRCACARRDDLRRKCAPVLREGALPRAEAEALRAEADGVVGGFLAKDEAYPTADVDFERLSANARAMVSEKWWPIIVREIRERCGYSTDDFVSPYRVVVSRYGDEVRKIHTHADAGDVTFTVLLNDPSEFEGGGTKFFGRVYKEGWVRDVGDDATMSPRAPGGLVVHGGDVTHESIEVMRGARYVLIGFSNVNRECCVDGDTMLNRIVMGLCFTMFALLACCWDPPDVRPVRQKKA